MGGWVFPSLPGLMLDQTRTPEWKTNIHSAVSGKEFRTAWRSAPLYRFGLQFEFLRNQASAQELQALVALLNRAAANFELWAEQQGSPA